MKILVTGSAGFIGSFLVQRLLERGDEVIGIDNHNDYYDPELKEDRLNQFIDCENYTHFRSDISNKNEIDDIFQNKKPEKVVNLAAQAGVRYSMENPHSYVDSNIVGFTNILEACRHNDVKHLVYASSSSVYGANTVMPFSVNHNIDHPLSLYAASKKANELFAHTYSNLYNLPTTGLRFFTVYGPWGRPDMALFMFTKAILNNKTIQVFNYGNHKRDFTYIDDVVECLFKLLNKPPKKSFHQIVNLGKGRGTDIVTFLKIIEKNLKKSTKVKFISKQQGDMIETLSSIKKLKSIIGFSPKISPEKGIKLFIDWYKSFYESKK